MTSNEQETATLNKCKNANSFILAGSIINIYIIKTIIINISNY